MGLIVYGDLRKRMGDLKYGITKSQGGTMKKASIILMAILMVGLVSAPGTAATVELYEVATNVNGNVLDSLLGEDVSSTTGFDFTSFNLSTGLGTIKATYNGAGAQQYVALFLDHEISQGQNTFFNEFGTTTGAPAAGQSWEIDEPGFSFGDIFTNFFTGALDNTNGVPSGTPDDVSMAMAWNFYLATTQTATIQFFVSDIAPTSGFYLAQTDPDSGASIYLGSTLDIKDSGTQVPEPSTLMLLATGLVGLAGCGRMRKRA